MSFLACRVFNENRQIQHRLVQMQESELSAGDVLVAVEYSSINYKDALACSGRGRILKQFPLNAGIDLAGTVLESSSPDFVVGDTVLANGCGLGEAHDGGLAQRARVPAQWLMKMPIGMSTREAMSYGTGGFTAALCLQRMEQNCPLRVGHVMRDDFLAQVIATSVHQLLAFAVRTDGFVQTKRRSFECVEFVERVPTTGAVSGLDCVGVNKNSGVPGRHWEGCYNANGGA